jgi:hypothetical protein
VRNGWKLAAIATDSSLLIKEPDWVLRRGSNKSPTALQEVEQIEKHKGQVSVGWLAMGEKGLRRASLQSVRNLSYDLDLVNLKLQPSHGH